MICKWCISNGTKGKKDNIQNMPAEVVTKIKEAVSKRGYNYADLCEDYKLRLRYNIDVMLNWEANYVYKGPKQFVSDRLF